MDRLFSSFNTFQQLVNDLLKKFLVNVFIKIFLQNRSIFKEMCGIIVENLLSCLRLTEGIFYD